MSFPDQMVAKYEALLLASAGAQAVTVDGQLVTFNDLEKKYAYWKRLAARTNGTRPRAARINLGGRCQ